MLINKKVTVIGLSSLVLVAVTFLFAHDVSAQASIGFPTDFANLSNQDLKTTIENIVRIVFGFLGILAVLFILYGGFVWMTSRGNAERVSQAKKIIVSAIIGLLLILTSYAIASFIVGNLANSLGGPGDGDGTGGGPGPGPGSLGEIIESHYPARGATGIPRNTRILITFKEDIRTSDFFDGGGNLNTANVIIENLSDGTIHDGTASSPDARLFTIVPNGLLGSSNGDSLYRVSLSNQIEKANGDTAMPFGYAWNFTVSSFSDNTAPTVTSVIPIANSTVARNTIVQINFSEAIDPGTVVGPNNSGSNIQVSHSGGTFTNGNYDISNQYKTVEFVTDELCGTNSCGGDVYCLAGGVGYQGSVLSGVTDIAGNALDPEFIWGFNTTDEIDLTAPYITHQAPNHESTNVDVNTPLEVYFNKPLSFSSVNSSNISLTGNVGYWLDAQVVGTETQVTVNHTQFDPQTRYDIAVTSEIKDINQNCYSPCSCVSSDGSCGCNVPAPGCTGNNCTSCEDTNCP